MPIDKMIPRFLVSDEDERLLKEGAMTDALNVAISEDGDGTEGVIKNIKGTKAGRAENNTSSEFADDDELVGIGAVNDDAEGYVYFFVADKTGSSQDAIYRYNTVAGTYRLVFKSSWLAFDEGNLIKADLLLISTAVEKVAINFNKPGQKWLDRITVAEAEQYIDEDHFAPGSMLPKIQAVIKFLKDGGKQALITDPPNMKRALSGETGTWILP